MENYKRYIRHVLASNFASDLQGYTLPYIYEQILLCATQEKELKSQEKNEISLFKCAFAIVIAEGDWVIDKNNFLQKSY